MESTEHKHCVSEFYLDWKIIEYLNKSCQCESNIFIDDKKKIGTFMPKQKMA